MLRREFVSLPALAVANTAANDPFAQEFFFQILNGYLSNARRTSSSMAVVEYPQATITQNFLAKSGLSATGVTRMLPAMAAWIASGRQPELNLMDDFAKAIRNGTDPESRDYWGASPAGRSNQRQVESSIVAWSVWLLRDKLLAGLSATQRRNVAAWLRSCTLQPVRNNNWAWFTAVNHAACLSLSAKYPEFQGSEAEMLEDLKVLDRMATGDSGWYNDGFVGHAYDYYNSWVFASHFLYWSRIAGKQYPDWSLRFSGRLKKYLETTPYFFAGNGANLLYGRSLIYRFGVLTPLVLSYLQGMWPHSPGLLRRIVRRNLEWHQQIGGFDASTGKLRETMTPAGSPAIRETYIDGGHPYWGMQAYALWMIPAGDPFWSDKEELLPVEKGNFTRVLKPTGMLLTGDSASGEVRLYQGGSTRPDPHYRDKYNKFVYSSHFAFAGTHDAKAIPADHALLLRNTTTGETAGRGPILTSNLGDRHMRLSYELKMGSVTAAVETEIRREKLADRWTHTITTTGGALDSLELVEGSAALGLTQTGAEVKLMMEAGWQKLETMQAEGSVLYGRHTVQVLRAALQPRMKLESLHSTSLAPAAR